MEISVFIPFSVSGQGGPGQDGQPMNNGTARLSDESRLRFTADAA